MILRTELERAEAVQETVPQRDILFCSATIVGWVLVGAAVLLIHEELPGVVRETMRRAGWAAFIAFCVACASAVASLAAIAATPWIVRAQETRLEMRFILARISICSVLGAIATAAITIVLLPGADWPGAILYYFLLAAAFLSLLGYLISLLPRVPTSRQRWVRCGLLAIFLTSCLSLVVFTAIGLHTRLRTEGRHARQAGELY